MSTTFLTEWQRNPAEYVRKQFAELSRRMDAQAAETARAAELERYRASYAKRHTPNTPENAA